MRAHSPYILLLFLVSIAACRPYKDHLMLKAPEDYKYSDFEKAAKAIELNYVIQVNDRIRVSVFTNDGERIIDPDYELLKELPANQVNSRPDPDYLIREDGFVRLPLLGDVKLTGLTLNDANLYLQEKYNTFYTNSYVDVAFANKRVIVLGGSGGQLIPLVNENVTVAEVIAMTGGLQREGKAQNIRLVRGKEVFLVDLSTIDSFLKSNMIAQPNDIIYIEPNQNVAAEVARDITPWVALITSFATLILVALN